MFVVDSLQLLMNDKASSSPHFGPKTGIEENLKQERSPRVIYGKGFVYFSEIKGEKKRVLWVLRVVLRLNVQDSGRQHRYEIFCLVKHCRIHGLCDGNGRLELL